MILLAEIVPVTQPSSIPGGVGTVIAAVGALMMGPIANLYFRWRNDQAKQRRDDFQTQIFERMHEEQVKTREALIATTVKSDERWVAFTATNLQQHNTTLQEIKSACKYCKEANE